MKVYTGLNQLPVFQNAVVTIGTFDGVHQGHSRILKRLIEKAQEINGESVIITFDPHPRFVVSLDQKSISLLSTPEEKKQALSDLGIDHLVVVPFTKEFAAMEATDYIEHFLVKHFHPHTVIIGFDHQFGKNRQGNFRMLEEKKQDFQYELEEIPMQQIEQNKISSTRIREALNRGDVSTAGKYLGRPYSIQGVVIQGMKRGKSLGFPTANIRVDLPEKLIPATGVYAVWVDTATGSYKGMMNIGYNPTFTDEKTIHLEVCLLDFDGDLYGQNIRVRFVDRLRDEKKFSSVEELIEALQTDRQKTYDILQP